MTDAMIQLDKIRKEFPSQPEPAVDDLTLSVPAGQVAVLVGPSGCGKTTTMKMVNRLIEPTSGRIYLGGEDVTRQDPDQLRRHIGYVIQQIGLFPHKSIHDNIATVPRLLGWPKDRIRRQVDDLLDLVGMDPKHYRDRYPKELSGGQSQRVGVARALSADPPVMLMDEPFGALDPITRERLQNEFLRLQQAIRKTVIFVTHDIDEAIKMGDRIAILRQGSRIAQYDTPATILSAPADDFVRDFIGGGASLRRLGLARLHDQRLGDWPVLTGHEDCAQARRALATSQREAVLIVDGNRGPLSWVSHGDLSQDGRRLENLGRPVEQSVSVRETLSVALDEMVRTQSPAVPVIDEHGCCVGVVDIDVILRAADTMRQEAASETMSSSHPGDRGGLEAPR